MIADQLKKAVLQAAVLGRLTEQFPGDGDARELLAEILAEKERMVKEGKLKKENPLPPITEDEIPFEIPPNWCWVRLGDIIFNRGQKKPDKKFTYIDISSIDNKNNRLGDLDNILHPKDAPSRARKIVNKGDVIYATVRPYLHNVCIIDREIDPEPIVSTGFAVVSSVHLIINAYLFWCFLTPMFDEYANDNENAKGVAYPAINDGKFLKAIISLPPLAEQQRIVDKLHEILPHLEKLSQDEIKLEELQKSFPQQLKSSLLQAAIQGKLTDQLSEDGNARDLLEEIKAEKQRLISSGKLKKEKPLPPITEDEIPFDIPENWSFARLIDICDINTGNSIPQDVKDRKYSVKGNGLPYIGTKDVSFDQKIDYDNGIFIPIGEDGFRLAPKNSILLCLEGGSAGRKIGMTSQDVYFGNKLCKFESIIFLPKFVFFYLQSSDFQKLFISQMTGIIGGVGVNCIKSIPIPIPPLAEQKRIVERLQVLLPLCDALD